MFIGVSFSVVGFSVFPSLVYRLVNVISSARSNFAFLDISCKLRSSSSMISVGFGDDTCF